MTVFGIGQYIYLVWFIVCPARSAASSFGNDWNLIGAINMCCVHRPALLSHDGSSSAQVCVLPVVESS